ncbi:helix-turn-helix domain-containing protein [Embleya scabrispora]|uniref:helix-turn-helix domain-containing protein n=1 Tax=Embleya scabrispora TaxID=159449 RepID=UPI001F1D69A1|nr:helix-turn-helix transcriptional regulator [Embleya scabrispora]
MNKGQLGAALRAVRKASGKEAKTVARSALMSQSKLSKIENARLTPSVTDVERILVAIGVSADIRHEYLEAAREAASETTALRHLKRVGAHKGQQALQALDAQMSLLRLFQPALVPGLLQTPEYIHAILSRHGLGEDVLARTVSGRLERQQILHDTTKSLRFVITEPVLRWRIVSAGMMAGQIDRIVSVSRLDNVDIRLVPMNAPQTDIANHSFVIRDDRMVTLETMHATIVVTDPRDIDVYVRKFEDFAAKALCDEHMRSALEGIRDEFLREREIDR